MSVDSEKYAELAQLLDQAAAIIDSLEELNLYCPFDTPAEFSFRVRELAACVRREEHGALRKLFPLFAPTGAWDDTMGWSDMDLANQIYALMNHLERNAEE